MAILRFDEVQLRRDLEQLPPRLRVAFAAACAERLRPAYPAFAAKTQRGDPGTFEALLDRLWNDIEGRPMTDDEVSRAVDAVMTLIPREEEEPWIIEQSYAEDAGAALAYALRCRQRNESQEAALSARRACDAVDLYVTAPEAVDLTVPGALEQIVSHPLVQAEFARQRRDLEELRAAGADASEAIAEVRERAKRDAPNVFSIA